MTHSKKQRLPVMITINCERMKQQMTREEVEQRRAAIRAERRMILERAKQRQLELAWRLSDMHVERALRRLRGLK